MKAKEKVPQAVSDFVLRLARDAILQEDGTLVVHITADDFTAFLAAVDISCELPEANILSAREQKFAAWMDAIDEVMWGSVGCSVYDLPDYPYRALFDDGMSAAEAAQEAFRDTYLSWFG